MLQNSCYSVTINRTYVTVLYINVTINRTHVTVLLYIDFSINRTCVTIHKITINRFYYNYTVNYY